MSRRERPPYYRWSPSSLRMWRKCKGRWHARYKAGWRDKPTRWTITGVDAHNALAKMALARLNGHLPREAPVDASEVESLTRDATARELLLKRRESLAFDHTYIVETWWRHLGCAGIWDRVDLTPGEALVYDYKTGSRKSARELTLDPATGLYLSAARARWPEREVSLWFWWLKPGTWTKVPWTPQLESSTRALVAAADLEHARASYPFTYGPHCGTCQLRVSCPEYERVGREWSVGPNDG